MTAVEKTTRSTTTTTYRIAITDHTTLDDLRRFVEDTVHLGAGSPIQTDLFGSSLSVHETRINDDQEQA